MAYQQTIATNTDPIIQMVRSVNVLLSQKPSAEIRKALNDHAFPRIRMRILSATSSGVNGEGTSSNSGVSIWFDNLADMADPLQQAAANSLIDLFITGNALIKDGIYSVAARLAASLLTSGLAAQVTPQANYAMELEKTAMADLEKLIRTPFFNGAVASIKESKLAAKKIPRIFIAADINDDISTYSSAENTGLTYTGTPVGGQAQLYIGYSLTDIITYTFPAGTTPAQILAGLSAAWRLKQYANQVAGNAFINVVIAPDEGQPVTGVRTVQYKTYPGATNASLQSPAVNTNMGFLQVTPYLYDKVVDFLNVEMTLKHESTPGSGIYDLPGVPGVLYGIEPLYSGLTHNGPHSLIIDVTTGQSTAAASASTNPADKTLSDTFYFGVSAAAEAARATATLTGVVVATETFTVTVDGNAYTYTAVGGAPTAAGVLAGLASLVIAGGLFTASVTGSVLTVTSLVINASQNGLSFGVSTTSAAASFTTGFSILDMGRDANTMTTTGAISYRFQEMRDPLNVVPGSINRLRAVAATRGEPVLAVVKRLADDIASFSQTSRCLGALRAPTVFKIMGTPFNAPGLTIVPYVRDTDHFMVVFDILSVPDGLLFAPLPYELLPSPSDTYFDSHAKSLIVPAKFIPSASAGSSAAKKAITETDQGEVKVAQPIHSSRIRKAFSDIGRMLQ